MGRKAEKLATPRRGREERSPVSLSSSGVDREKEKNARVTAKRQMRAVEKSQRKKKGNCSTFSDLTLQSIVDGTK